MTNLIIHEYYYRYRERRQLIKNQLVDIGNYTEAKTQLENTIAEHNQKYPTEVTDTRKDFNYGEKIMMNHALNHLNAVIDQNDPSFINSDDGSTTGHQSDIVKEALLHVPKSDYTDLEEE